MPRYTPTTSPWRALPRWVRRAAGVLLLVQALLTLGYVGFIHGLPATRQFNLDGELNVPTWWSSALLTAAAGAAVGIGLCNSRLGRPVLTWMLIGVGFLGLSMEEVASIHEDVGSTLGGGASHVSIWPVVYLPFVIAGTWLIVRAVRDLPRGLGGLAVVTLIAYAGVMGLELTSLLDEGYVTIAIEENLEMLGTGVMFCCMAAEMSVRLLALFGDPRPSGPPPARRAWMAAADDRADRDRT
jgi:hypothetical protein